MTRSFAELWDKHVELDLPTTDPRLCSFALRFQLWSTDLVDGVLASPTVVTLNQAKVLLLDKYYEWRRSVPKAHRGLPDEDRGHMCLFHVFLDAYEQIRVAELEITPPMLFLPPLPPPPSPQRPRQIGGIFLGEEDE